MATSRSRKSGGKETSAPATSRLKRRPYASATASVKTETTNYSSVPDPTTNCWSSLHQNADRHLCLRPLLLYFVTMHKQLKLSALDLSVIIEGGNAASAIARTVEAARYVEQLGYDRIWLAEHHNMENIASSATSVLIGHVAGKTDRIRVGSGGIMLPNHAPLAIA